MRFPRLGHKSDMPSFAFSFGTPAFGALRYLPSCRKSSYPEATILKRPHSDRKGCLRSHSSPAFGCFEFSHTGHQTQIEPAFRRLQKTDSKWEPPISFEPTPRTLRKNNKMIIVVLTYKVLGWFVMSSRTPR